MSGTQSRIDRIYQQSVLKPPYLSWSFARRFFVYQNERFPILAFILACGILVAALAKLDHHFDTTRLILAATMAVLYFMQIRIADEPKDFEHDNVHHPKRPVQRGLVTLKELSYVKTFCTVGFMAAACLTLSPWVIGIALLQQGYSFLTRKEFFIREWLRDHFLIYQYSHYAQLLLLAGLLVVTADIARSFLEGAIYGAYIIAMIAPIEASRTIGGSDEARARDRFSHRLGVAWALTGYLVLSCVAVGATLWLIEQSGYIVHPFILIIGVAVVVVASVRYGRQPISKNADILNVASLALYIACATTILIG